MLSLEAREMQLTDFALFLKKYFVEMHWPP